MNTIQDETLRMMRSCIEKAGRIAVFCHIRPDGDTIGSVLGFGWALELAGKKVQFVSQDNIPPQGRFCFEEFIEGFPFVKTPESFDCSILMDISDIQRAGIFFNQKDSPVPDICIDHHFSNPGIARINWIDSEAAATAIIAAKLIPMLGLTIDKKIASALLSGIMTDTQSFSTRNTDPEALRTAAELMGYGADLYNITQTVIMAHSFEAGKYWGYGLEKMQLERQVLWSILSLEDQEKSGYPGQDDANLINYLSTTENAKITVLFVEQNSDSVKVSWRGKPGVDVSGIAESFGGGGHVLAAGATINESLKNVIPTVLEATKKVITEN